MSFSFPFLVFSRAEADDVGSVFFFSRGGACRPPKKGFTCRQSCPRNEVPQFGSFSPSLFCTTSPSHVNPLPSITDGSCLCKPPNVVVIDPSAGSPGCYTVPSSSPPAPAPSPSPSARAESHFILPKLLGKSCGTGYISYFGVICFKVGSPLFPFLFLRLFLN